MMIRFPLPDGATHTRSVEGLESLHFIPTVCVWLHQVSSNHTSWNPSARNCLTYRRLVTQSLGDDVSQTRRRSSFVFAYLQNFKIPTIQIVQNNKMFFLDEEGKDYQGCYAL